MRIAELHQHGAFRVAGELTRKRNGAQLIGGAITWSDSHYSLTQRRAAADVLSLAAPVRTTARSARLVSVCRKFTPGALSSLANSLSRTPAHMPSVHTSRTSFGSSGRRFARVMSGRMGSPPRQH